MEIIRESKWNALVRMENYKYGSGQRLRIKILNTTKTCWQSQELVRKMHELHLPFPFKSHLGYTQTKSQKCVFFAN